MVVFHSLHLDGIFDLITNVFLPLLPMRFLYFLFLELKSLVSSGPIPHAFIFSALYIFVSWQVFSILSSISPNLIFSPDQYVILHFGKLF